MSEELEQIPLSRYPLIGLFSGIFAAFINFVLFGMLASPIGTSIAGLLNIGTIFYSTIIPTFLGGLILYLLRNVKGGTVLYMIFFSLITAFVLYKGMTMHFYDNPQKEHIFHKVLLSILSVTWIFTTIVVPILAKNRKFTNSFI